MVWGACIGSGFSEAQWLSEGHDETFLTNAATGLVPIRSFIRRAGCDRHFSARPSDDTANDFGCVLFLKKLSAV